jgi:co-chaperonin GroES (HSP10)
MIKPLGGIILVSEIEVGEKTTKGGLVISSIIVNSGPKMGTVVSIGAGEANYKGEVIPINNINVGDVVYYPEHTGITIEDEDGSKYLLVNSKNILAVKG